MAIDLTGQRFGNYRAVRLIGEGGFGAVYLAEHPFVTRKAAIKVLHPMMARDPELLARFLNEARAATAIRHENIIEIFDAGLTEDGTPYILMEFLDGEPLKARIQRLGRLPVNLAVRFAIESGSALNAAHQAGIVHRDLKPENIFVVPKAGRAQDEHVKILDFGIAKLSGAAASDSVKTQIGQFMGSPAYMSPEQWGGESGLDHRTDIYALGVILFEMLVGRPPFESNIAFELREMHLRSIPPAMGELVPEVPAHLDSVVRRAMAKDPAQRFPNMAEMVAALGGRVSAPAIPATPLVATMALPAEAVSGGPVVPSPPLTTMSAGTGERPVDKTSTSGMRPARKARRHTPLVLGAVLVVAAAGITLSWVRGKGPEVRGTAPPVAPSSPAPSTRPAAVQPARDLRQPHPAPGPQTPVVESTRPREIGIRVRSNPAGAAVIDATSGKLLGKTPLDRRIEPGERPGRLRLQKRGWKTQIIDTAADGDIDAEVTLEKAPPQQQQEGDVVL